MQRGGSFCDASLDMWIAADAATVAAVLTDATLAVFDTDTPFAGAYPYTPSPNARIPLWERS